VGTAPGMWMKKENTVFISLPGCRMMKYLVENEIFQGCKEYERPYIIHKTILITDGEGEFSSS
jgi:nicotinamide-nucleotide amidase